MMLSEIASLLHVACTDNFNLHGVCIDSRQIKPGSLFIALQGERYDGHQFITDAVDKGACAVVCCQKNEQIKIPQLVVSDTSKALADIAAFHRQKFTGGVVALTGSNGKTTVKEMIASILPAPSYATYGNFNNHIGVPLSVLQLSDEHRYAVFELGANHIGEIAHTVAIVKPKVTLINNIAPAHIEGFGSLDGVAVAKGEIHQGLIGGGTAVINDDDDYAHFWDSIVSGKNIVRFSQDKPVDIYAQAISFATDGCAQFTLVTPKGDASIKLQVPGRHNVSNALAAASCSYALGIGLNDIIAGLSRFGGVQGRMTYCRGKQGALIIDDTYNANLRSVLSALDVLSQFKGRRILVLGDMAELGAWSKEHHQQAGLKARQLGVDEVFTYGKDSEHTADAFGSHSQHYTCYQALADDLLRRLETNTTILVKGSRACAMENIVKQLVD